METQLEFERRAGADRLAVSVTTSGLMQQTINGQAEKITALETTVSQLQAIIANRDATIVEQQAEVDTLKEDAPEAEQKP